MHETHYHLIIYVPVADAQKIRDILANHGAGKTGNYDSCSFSLRGIGRFRPLKGSDPAIGVEGKLEEVEEERIEVIIPPLAREKLQNLLRAVKDAHPYEEPAINLLPLIDYTTLL